MSNGQRWKGIQKCYPFEEKRLLTWKPPYIVQPKFDGVRCRAIPLETGNCLLLSSEENVIFSVPHITAALNKANFGVELDGELYCHGLSFEEIVSITSRTVNLHPNYGEIKFHIFDIVSDKPQASRTKTLNDKIFKGPLIGTPYWIAEDLEDIMRIYDHLIELGYEGIIVRNLHAPYIRKRSIWVMKFKPKKEDTYEITGYTEEISKSGNPKGSLGAIICASGDGSTFQVGSGFTREQRDNLWRDRESLEKYSIRVQYQHLSVGRKVPRFPVFVDIVEECK